MLIQAKVIIGLAAVVLVTANSMFELTSVVWNLVALPLILCVLSGVLAAIEYFTATAEKHDANVHCIFQNFTANGHGTPKSHRQNAA